MTNIMKAEIEKQKVLRGLKNKDIAKAIGVPDIVVRQVMTNAYKGDSLRVERAICKFLGIEYF